MLIHLYFTYKNAQRYNKSDFMMWFILFTSCPVSTVWCKNIPMYGWPLHSLWQCNGCPIQTSSCSGVFVHLSVYSPPVIYPKHVLKHVFKTLVIGSTMCYLMGMSSHALNDSIYIEIWMSNMQILLGGRFLAMVKINHIFRSYGDKTGKFKCFK